MRDGQSASPHEEGEAARGVRKAAGVAEGEGPSDSEIADAIEGFAQQFGFWYTRVIAEAVGSYRKLVIGRINPLVRQMEFNALGATDVARRLVQDYVNRNYVTAGGWAIEKMAIALGGNNAKAAAEGIDLHRYDPDTGDEHLYVIKSGTVTRNSDILKALKNHARRAEKLINQGGGKKRVFANYAVATGSTTSTFHDGIFRPSSAQFWSEVSGLEADKALRLVREIAIQAGKIINEDSQPHIDAMRALVEAYLETEPGSGEVDWDFVFDRTMREKDEWKAEDAARHARAVKGLAATGYVVVKKAKRPA
ncbi:PmeII family type II restriction endonuclease [Litorisediminicola beolgyonensis]|uniref:PmeII family type II restriction endonuclease n=1 Tax=Litorisediminicola beolgyonensis TaxID=1173614 RepID=UPI0036D9A1D7